MSDRVVKASDMTTRELLAMLRSGHHRAMMTALAGVQHDERCLAAADRIDEMADEIERLRSEMASGSFYQEKDIDAMQDEITRLRAEVERLREAERTAWEPPPARERPFNFECLGWVYGGWDFVFWNDTHWVTRKGNPCTPGHFRPMPPAPKQEPH